MNSLPDENGRFFGWTRSWELTLGVSESGHAAEEEGEHVQVGEAGKINKLTRVRGGQDTCLRPK